MEKIEDSFQPFTSKDVVLEIHKKSYFTVLVNKKIENNKYCSPEEILIEMLFNYHSIKFQKIEYFSQQIGFFIGNLPVIYAFNNIVENKNLIKFLLQIIFKQETPFTEKLENLNYILKEVYKNAFDYLVFSKNKEIFISRNPILGKLKYFFYSEYIYEKNIKIIFNNLSLFNDKNEYYISSEEKAKALVLHSLILIKDLFYSEIKRKEKTTDYKSRESFLVILIYSFIKEEIDNPKITGIFSSNKEINDFKNEIINYIEYEIKKEILSKKTAIGKNNPSIILTENLLIRIQKNNCIKYHDINNPVNLFKKRVFSIFISNLLTIFIFFGSSILFMYISDKRPRQTSKNRLFPKFKKV